MAITTKARAHVGTVVLGKSTKLEVNVVRHSDDKDFVDIRTWFANIYAGGAWTPTKKGVHLPLTTLPELLQLLEAAKTAEVKNVEAGPEE